MSALTTSLSSRVCLLCSWARHLQCLSPHRCSTQVYEFSAGCNPVIDGLASHPGGSTNTLSHFMLLKPEISVGLVARLAQMQTLPI